MISMRLIQKISLALPNSFLEAPDDVGRVYIQDKNGERIADIDIRNGDFTIYDEYEYCQQVIDSLESQGEKVRDVLAERKKREKEYLDANPDKAELLYGKP